LEGAFSPTAAIAALRSIKTSQPILAAEVSSDTIVRVLTLEEGIFRRVTGLKAATTVTETKEEQTKESTRAETTENAEILFIVRQSSKNPPPDTKLSNVLDWEMRNFLAFLALLQTGASEEETQPVGARIVLLPPHGEHGGTLLSFILQGHPFIVRGWEPDAQVSTANAYTKSSFVELPVQLPHLASQNNYPHLMSCKA
jgi:hypothetical protein